MLGLSPQQTWTVLLLALSMVAFAAAARWYRLLSTNRALFLYGVGFSLGFVALAVLSGLSVLR